MRFNSTSALTIETTKLYTGYPGKIKIYLCTIPNSDGYVNLLDSVFLNTQASSPSPSKANNGATPYVVGDSGLIYRLNLKVPQAGDYILLLRCDTIDGTTVFRNSGLSDPTYPIGPNKVFSYTGNSLLLPPEIFKTFSTFFIIHKLVRVIVLFILSY
jgi:hypothetical protein